MEVVEYQFDIRYTASKCICIDANSYEEAKEQVQGALELEVPNLDYYEVKAWQEFPRPKLIAHFACGLQLEDEDDS